MLILLVRGTRFENQCFREYNLSFLLLPLVSELLDPFHMAVEVHGPVHLSVLARGQGTLSVQNLQTECWPPHMVFFFLPDKRY